MFFLSTFFVQDSAIIFCFKILFNRHNTKKPLKNGEKSLQGIFAAVPTPVNLTRAPLLDLFISHCKWVLKNGCHGINILGSTGEANSFDIKTRKNIMGVASKELDINRLMVGTGTPSLLETVELTKFADSLGYKVALVLPGANFYRFYLDDFSGQIF